MLFRSHRQKKKSFYKGGLVRVVAVDEKAGGQAAHNQGFEQVRERLERRK